MASIEKSGRTVEEAINAALQELGVAKDDVEIEVLEGGSRGMLGGIIGSQQARVRVTLKKPKSILEEVVKSIVERMGVVVSVEEPVEREGAFYINISGDDAGLIIGRNGVTLDAMQVIVSEIVRKRSKAPVLIWVDADRYRERRWEQVRRMALEAVQRAKAERRRIKLHNLTAAERRIVHLMLQNNPDVVTYSEGEEPNRLLIIAPANLAPKQRGQHERRQRRMQQSQRNAGNERRKSEKSSDEHQR